MPHNHPKPHRRLEAGLYDATDDLKAIVQYLQSGKRIILPQQYRQALLDTLGYLSATALDSRPNTLIPQYTPQPTGLPSAPSTSNSSSSSNLPQAQDLDLHEPVVRTNVKLNKCTILDKVIFHPPGALVEYPETSRLGRIGHIFSMNLNSAGDISDWFNPTHNFAYSQGEPRGSSGLKVVKCALLTDMDGNEVDCKESHSTCELQRLLISGYYGTLIIDIGQGSKACSFADWARLVRPHTKASLEDISICLEKDSVDRSANNTPERQLFQKTLAFFYSVKKYGCTGPTNELGRIGPSEDAAWKAQINKARRGHSPKAKCDGTILFQHTGDGKPYLR